MACCIKPILMGPPCVALVAICTPATPELQTVSGAQDNTSVVDGDGYAYLAVAGGWYVTEGSVKHGSSAHEAQTHCQFRPTR